MKDIDLNFVKLVINALFILVTITIGIEFVLKTVSWVMLKLIIIDFALFYVWLWIEVEKEDNQ